MKYSARISPPSWKSIRLLFAVLAKNRVQISPSHLGYHQLTPQELPALARSECTRKIHVILIGSSSVIFWWRIALAMSALLLRFNVPTVLIDTRDTIHKITMQIRFFPKLLFYSTFLHQQSTHVMR